MNRMPELSIELLGQIKAQNVGGPKIFLMPSRRCGHQPLSINHLGSSTISTPLSTQGCGDKRIMCDNAGFALQFPSKDRSPCVSGNDRQDMHV